MELTSLMEPPEGLLMAEPQWISLVLPSHLLAPYHFHISFEMQNNFSHIYIPSRSIAKYID
jgi:hypothetical protein